MNQVVLGCFSCEIRTKWLETQIYTHITHTMTTS